MKKIKATNRVAPRGDANYTGTVLFVDVNGQAFVAYDKGYCAWTDVRMLVVIDEEDSRNVEYERRSEDFYGCGCLQPRVRASYRDSRHA